MAASKKTTRESRYREILMADGISFDDCRVLAFSFEVEKAAETLHLSMMNAERRPEYYLFDLIGTLAQIVVPNDGENAQRIQAIAADYGGQKTTPNLR